MVFFEIRHILYCQIFCLVDNRIATHASLMAVAWGVLIPLSIVIARHSKNECHPMWCVAHACHVGAGACTFVFITVCLFIHVVRWHNWRSCAADRFNCPTTVSWISSTRCCVVYLLQEPFCSQFCNFFPLTPWWNVLSTLYWLLPECLFALFARWSSLIATNQAWDLLHPSVFSVRFYFCCKHALKVTGCQKRWLRVISEERVLLGALDERIRTSFVCTWMRPNPMNTLWWYRVLHKLFEAKLNEVNFAFW